MSTYEPFLFGNDYRALPRSPQTWVIENLLPVGGLLNIFGPPKGGKAAALDTPLLTPDGWRTIADIQPGDSVYGSNGLPITVVAISPTYVDHQCYRITFDDYTSVVVDAGHEWTVRSKSNHLPCTLTTQTLVDRGVTTEKSSRYPRKQWQIDLTQPILFTTAADPLPIDPYVLGAWLGDGTSCDGSITSADPEVIENIQACGYVVAKRPASPYTYGIKGLARQLTDLGVANNKHIPEAYLKAPVDSRKALLAGLLDTDGWAGKGTATFYNTNEILARQVYDLAVQLGCKTTFHNSKRAKLNGVDYGICYEVNIRSPFQLFKLSRKAANFRLNTEQYRTITAIEPVETVPVKCLVVDAQDHLFLIGRNCIPTHNSWVTLQLAAAVSDPGISDWLTFPIHTHGPVCYLQLDTPRTLWSLRLDQTEAAGIDLSRVAFTDSERAPYPFDILGTARDPVSAGWTYLREQVQQIQPVLLIIDTLREIHSGDENASDQMHNVMAALRHATHPTALVLISHSRKENMAVPESQRTNLLDDNRGSNYISGRMDGIVKVTSTRKASQLSYQSRTVERSTLKCHRLPPGLWVADGAQEEPIIRAVLADASLTSLAARAEALAPRLGKTPEACRSLLRRRLRASEGHLADDTDTEPIPVVSSDWEAAIAEVLPGSTGVVAAGGGRPDQRDQENDQRG